MSIAIEEKPAIVSPSSLVVGTHRGGLEIIDRLADEWRELCVEAPDDQPFFRPEFIQAHIRSMNPKAKLLIITVRRNNQLNLILPLVEELATFSKMPVRRLRVPANFYCGRFDAARKPGWEGDEAVSAAWEYLKKINGWDLLHLRFSQDNSTVSRICQAARTDGFVTMQAPDHPNPYVPIPTDRELLKQLPQNARLRTKLRQIRRQIAEQGALRFYRVDSADRETLDRIYALEASGWKGRSRSATNYRASVRKFFDELAESAARFGYLSLYMLEFNGELIAAHFALTYKNRCYSPIVAYNEDFKQFAPGHLIVSEMLEDFIARGIVGYDITGVDQEWKMRWTSELRSVSHHFVFKGAIGRFVHAMGVDVKTSVKKFFGGFQKIA